MIIIGTRWHEADLIGWLLKEHPEEGWQLVNLAALAEADDLLRRAEGEALWPESFDVERLAAIRKAIGGAAFASLYQQRPAAAEGAIFKREWWGRYKIADLPKFEQRIISLDTAFKTGATNDFSAAVVIGVAHNAYHVLDVVQERLEYPALRRKVEALDALWRPTQVLIEDKASGQSLGQSLRAETRLPVKMIKVDGDKVARANAVTAIVEAGRVLLPESAPWLDAFLDHMSVFPAGAHDDICDSLTQALNHLRGSFVNTIAWAQVAALGRLPDMPEYEPPTFLLEQLNLLRKCTNCSQAIRQGESYQEVVHGEYVHSLCPKPPEYDSFSQEIPAGPPTLDTLTGLSARRVIVSR